LSFIGSKGGTIADTLLSLLIMKKLYRIGCCVIVLFITVCFFNTTTETTEGLKEGQTEHQYFFIQEGVDWEDIFPCKNATDEHFFPRKTVEVEHFFIGISVEDQIFIKEVCEYYEFDEKLIYQIMSVESGFDANAVSKTNDHGIMQINKVHSRPFIKDNSDGFGDDFEKNFDYYNIRHNVVVGIRMLNYTREMCQRYGLTRTQDYIQAYNQGVWGYLKNRNTGYSTRVLNTEIDSYVSVYELCEEGEIIWDLQEKQKSVLKDFERKSLLILTASRH
jgi:hypothetical protein